MTWLDRKADPRCPPPPMYLLPRCNVGPMDRVDMGLTEPCAYCPHAQEYREEIARRLEIDAQEFGT